METIYSHWCKINRDSNLTPYDACQVMLHWQESHPSYKTIHLIVDLVNKWYFGDDADKNDPEELVQHIHNSLNGDSI